MPGERQVDIDERVRESEALPGGLAVAEAFPELDLVEDMEREAGDLGQPPGEGLFAAAGIAEDRDLVHYSAAESAAAVICPP